MKTIGTSCILLPAAAQAAGGALGQDAPGSEPYLPSCRLRIVHRLDRVDLNRANDDTLVKKLELPSIPSHVTFAKDSAYAFVTLQGSDEIAAIDLRTQSVSWKLNVGKTPAGIVTTNDGRYLLVGVMGENHVAAVDWRARQVVKKIPTGGGAHNLAPRGDGRHFFVSNCLTTDCVIVEAPKQESGAQQALP